MEIEEAATVVVETECKPTETSRQKKKQCPLCSRMTKRESGYCYQHDPDILAVSRKLADERLASIIAKATVKKEFMLTEVGVIEERFEKAKMDLLREESNLNEMRREVSSASAQLIELRDNAGDISRLRECYEAAKTSGDAATMLHAQKCLYYASRNAIEKAELSARQQGRSWRMLGE